MHMHSIQDAAIVISLKKESDKRAAGSLRAPGWLAQRPLIGLLMVVLGSLAFVAIATSVQTNGPLIQLDIPVSNAIHAAALQSAPVVRDVMILGFYVGEHLIVAIGALLAVYFLYKRFWPELGMVVIAWAGEGAIWLYLSQYYNRPRPVFDVPVWHQMTAPGFPSGHVIAAVMCYGLLAYLLIPKSTLCFWKFAISVMAGLIILYIGVSRLFVGDHYPSDVLAGYALGIAWAGLVYTTIEWITKKKRNGNVQEK
jgi:membrane-associated phospholipid phosphatase